jgi:hypothetical protein
MKAQLVPISVGLIEAAKFLRLHPEELRKRLKLGKIPGAKIGRSWVMLTEDLMEYVRRQYAQPPTSLHMFFARGDKKCPSSSEAKSGGSNLPIRVVSALDDLLKQGTGR